MNFSENRLHELVSLQDKINFQFSDLELLNKALTHKSYANEKFKNFGHNERLEFLGDSVLDILVSDFLVNNYNDFD